MIFLDYHSTTPLDPAALQAMMPLFTEQFANPGSVTYSAGRQVAELVEAYTAVIASQIGAEPDELVFTSGATESNNLALFGVMHHPRQKRRKIVSLTTEHKAILDPLKRLADQGFEVQFIPVRQQETTSGSHEHQPSSSSLQLANTQIQKARTVAGQADLQKLSEAIDDQTALVTIMLANNEIGVIQPIREIARQCRLHGCVLHTDATQAVGRLPVDVDELDVDLLSFSAHKFYGPKGIGGLFVRRRGRPVRLQAQIVGGGQQNNWRSGTLNTAGIVGMSVALENSVRNLVVDTDRIRMLRDLLFERLQQLPITQLNGPALVDEHRLAGNLNCCFYPLEGQSLMLLTPDLAVSSGSACTSARPEPSHVLQSIGLSEDHARSSLRFGIGRFTTQSEVEQAAQMLISAARRLLESSGT